MCERPHRCHARFRNFGYKLTLPRKVILDVLRKAKKHLSAEDIYLKVYKIYPHVGLTTIYRTLEILTNIGMVKRYDFGDRRARYELVSETREKHHIHLVCLNCCKIIGYSDFTDEEIKIFDSLKENLSEKNSFDIKYHQFSYHGLCNKCK